MKVETVGVAAAGRLYITVQVCLHLKIQNDAVVVKQYKMEKLVVHRLEFCSVY